MIIDYNYVYLFIIAKRNNSLCDRQIVVLNLAVMCTYVNRYSYAYTTQVEVNFTKCISYEIPYSIKVLTKSTNGLICVMRIYIYMGIYFIHILIYYMDKINANVQCIIHPHI